MKNEESKGRISEVPKKPGLYASPDDALKSVMGDYHYWSGKLTETSLQMCYGLIGANWLVFGSVQGILHSRWAELSLLMVLLALSTSVVGAWMLSEWLRARVRYGESHGKEWAKQFEESAGKPVPWPFTDRIQNTAKNMRWIKAIFTLAGGACLIVGAIVNRPVTTPAAPVASTPTVSAPAAATAPVKK
jgi:hypothetical protein